MDNVDLVLPTEPSTPTSKAPGPQAALQKSADCLSSAWSRRLGQELQQVLSDITTTTGVAKPHSSYHLKQFTTVTIPGQCPHPFISQQTTGHRPGSQGSRLPGSLFGSIGSGNSEELAHHTHLEGDAVSCQGPTDSRQHPQALATANNSAQQRTQTSAQVQAAEQVTEARKGKQIRRESQAEGTHKSEPCLWDHEQLSSQERLLMSTISHHLVGCPAQQLPSGIFQELLQLVRTVEPQGLICLLKAHTTRLHHLASHRHQDDLCHCSLDHTYVRVVLQEVESSSPSAQHRTKTSK